MPTLAVFQLYRGVDFTKYNLLNVQYYFTKEESILSSASEPVNKLKLVSKIYEGHFICGYSLKLAL